MSDQPDIFDFRCTRDGYTKLHIRKRIPTDKAAAILKILGMELPGDLIKMFDERHCGPVERAGTALSGERKH